MLDNDQYQSVPQNYRPDPGDGHDGPDTDDDILDSTHGNAACLLGDNDQGDEEVGSSVRLTESNSAKKIHEIVLEYLRLPTRRRRCVIGVFIFVILCIFILIILVINNINIKQVVHDPDEHFKVSIVYHCLSLHCFLP